MTFHTPLRAAATALLGAGILALAGCAATPAPAPAGTATTSPASTWVDDEPTELPARPTSDAAALDAARQRGVDALVLFLRPDVDSRTWLNDLTPYLTPDAYEDHRAGKPSDLPRVEVYTDQATVADGATSVTAIIAVPTSGGTWHVSLTRTGPDATWAVARFQPPYDA